MTRPRDRRSLLFPSRQRKRPEVHARTRGAFEQRTARGICRDHVFVELDRQRRALEHDDQLEHRVQMSDELAQPWAAEREEPIELDTEREPVRERVELVVKDLDAVLDLVALVLERPEVRLQPVGYRTHRHEDGVRVADRRRERSRAQRGASFLDSVVETDRALLVFQLDRHHSVVGHGGSFTFADSRGGPSSRGSPSRRSVEEGREPLGRHAPAPTTAIRRDEGGDGLHVVRVGERAALVDVEHLEARGEVRMLREHAVHRLTRRASRRGEVLRPLAGCRGRARLLRAGLPHSGLLLRLLRRPLRRLPRSHGSLLERRRQRR